MPHQAGGTSNTLNFTIYRGPQNAPRPPHFLQKALIGSGGAAGWLSDFGIL